MSVSRLFTVIGDGNVRRNWTQLNIASRESMKTAQVLSCADLGSLGASLAEVRQESSVCIFAAITEMFLAPDDLGSLAATYNNVLHSFKEKINEFCAIRPGLSVAVAPPLYRHRPFWYQKHLHQLAELFSSILSESKPANLHLLPSFSCQDLLPDGAFLSPVSGLHYVIHLFDQTESALKTIVSAPEVQFARVQESCRHYSDRLAYLEHRHDLQDARFDQKAAADAEAADWVENRSEEDWFMIQGHPRLPEANSGQWQMAAKRQVNEIIKKVLHANRVNLDYSVLYVSNPKRYRKTGQNVYNVQLNSVQASRRIRDMYSGFFKKGSPVRLPESLKGVSIRNKVTLNTRIRIAILRQLGVNFEESNPGGTFKLRGYDPRPTLVTIPPSSASGSYPRTFTFIQAVNTLSTQLSDDNLIQIHMVVGPSNPGMLESLFVVLKDDDRERIEGLIQAKMKSRQRGSGPSVSFSGVGSNSGTLSGHGSGMAAQSIRTNLMNPPPPPPPPISSVAPSRREGDRSRSRSPAKYRRSRSRSADRGHRSELKKRHRSPSSSSSSSERGRKRASKKKDRRSPSSEYSNASRGKKKASKKKKRGRRSPSPSSGSSSTSRSRTPVKSRER